MLQATFATHEKLRTTCWPASWLLGGRTTCDKGVLNDSSQVDDGEIWGSTLDLFFTDTTTVPVSRSESQALAEELLNVKQLLTQKVPDLTIDYLPYSYAFITASRDTFYADRKLSTWRYKRQRLTGKNALVNLGARH